MNLSSEEIKQWNVAISQLTAICNHHCTEERQCEGCPFSHFKFRDDDGTQYCPIRAAVLDTGDWRLSPEEYLRNLHEKCLRSCEQQTITKSCHTCHWRVKKTNYCPVLGIHILAPESRLCDSWKPRHDLFRKEYE